MSNVSGPIEILRYADDSAARAAIKDGDILLFRDGEPFHDKLIELGTLGPYCHSALAFRDWDIARDDRVFVVQATAAQGVHTRLLSEEVEGFRGHVEVWRIPSDRFPKWNAEKAVRFALDQVGKPYAMDPIWAFALDFITFGLFHFRSHARDKRKYFCSQLVSAACRKGGVDVTLKYGDAATSPNDIVTARRASFVLQFARTSASDATRDASGEVLRTA